MQMKTKIKAGGIVEKHNETLVRAQKAKQGLKVKTNIKAGVYYKGPPTRLDDY